MEGAKVSLGVGSIQIVWIFEVEFPQLSVNVHVLIIYPNWSWLIRWEVSSS
jgi:hypothetical protein